MRFLVDAQLPPALARWFADRGLAATPIRDLGLRDSDGGSIWNFAVAGDWVVVTKDEDFVVRCMSSANARRVLWLRIGNCTNRLLFALLEPLWEEIRKSIADGEKVIEVRA